MKSKILLKIISLPVLFIGLIFVYTYINSPTPITDTALISDTTDAKTGLPVRLRIPVINVNAEFEYVGLTVEGDVDAPLSPLTVGWFNMSPHPGDIGNSIIDGHSGWKNGVSAVFDNLYKIRRGDLVYVENDLGVTNVFTVKKIKNYDSGDRATDVFVSTDGKSHLILITCEGVWDPISKTSSKRLVIFADKSME